MIVMTEWRITIVNNITHSQYIYITEYYLKRNNRTIKYYSRYLY